MKYEFEKNVASDFISVLGNSEKITCAVKKWKDGRKDTVFPVILVKASDAREDAICTNYEGVFSAIVEVSAQTYEDDDKDRAVVDSTISKVREILYGKTLKTLLQAANLESQTGYEYISIEKEDGMYEGAFDNKNIASLTLTVFYEINL